MHSLLKRQINRNFGSLDAIPGGFEKMINSVLRNLLSNSVKFTRKNGIVVGKAREIEEGMVEISVTDTGVGIPGNTMAKLFKLGEKVGSKGTDNELSTGLGLVICKEFVEKHG